MPSLPALTRQIAGAIINGLTDADYSLGRRALILGGFLASGVRLSAGLSVGRLGPRPSKRLRLWDREGAPASRTVRENLSGLDLEAEIRPCPVGGDRYRAELGSGGVPRLHDPHTEVVLEGSCAIVRYLHESYGVGWRASLLDTAALQALTGLAVRALTGDAGRLVRASNLPSQPLELWSFEASPYCRFARAALCELQLPYVLHNVAKDSPGRPAFIARSGEMRVPFLHDPNTGQSLFESLRIEQYLQATYGEGRSS